MKTRVLALVLAVVAANVAFGQDACKCKPIPNFSAKATDGKTYNPAAITAKPTVVFFLKWNCPHNEKAAKDLNRIAAELKGKVNVVAFTNLDAVKAKEFAKKHALTFPVIADPSKKVSEGFGAERSLDFALLCADDKKMVKLWSGYDRASLAEMVKLLPSHGGGKAALTLTKYPTEHQSGCSL